MLPSSTSDRGQAEPLAALVAVTVLAVGLAMYGGFITDALPGSSDRAVSQVTMDRVWNEVSENSRFHPSEISPSDLEERVFPEGRVVYVNVTRMNDDGRMREVFEAKYAPGQDHATALSGTVDRPSDPDRSSRPIPIYLGDGRAKAGTLTVEVWQ